MSKKWSGERGSNPRPLAWKANALPIELPPQKNGGGGRIRTSEGIRQQIYSLIPLATREPLQHGADSRNRTHNRSITSRVLYR